MVGSRLLFSGYGDGPWSRPQHAGLLGQDALIVNDESHLTPAFAKLLLAIEEMQRTGPRSRHIKTMRLSATPSRTDCLWPESLEKELAHEGFRKRYLGSKRLFLHSVSSRKDEEKKAFELATGAGGARRLIFIRQPERALALKRDLEKAGFGRTCLLTGTMRGWERDLLRMDPVFESFQKESPPLEPCYMVATSAGEVGVDISADVLVTDLESAGHLVQRFGRLNRHGAADGVAHLVHVGFGDPKKPWLGRTLEYLRQLGGDENEGFNITCRNLHERPAPSDCEPEESACALLRPRLVDLWSQTSRDVRRARRSRSLAIPDIASWLHGKEDESGPETEIAWREDVKYLTRTGVDREEIRIALRKHRLLSKEKLREPTKRAAEKLGVLAKLAPEARVLVIFPDGSVEAVYLPKVADEEILAYASVILSPGVGRLSNGMWEPELRGEGDAAEYDDVADRSDANNVERARYLVTRQEEGNATFQPIGFDGPTLTITTLNGSSVLSAIGMTTSARVEIPPLDEGESDAQFVYYLRKPGKTPPKREVFLKDHHYQVESLAVRLAQKLGLQESVTEAMRIAGKYHDAGKRRKIWQLAAGGSVEEPIAKPYKAFAPAILGGFRHELASLRDVPHSKGAEDKASDLAMHLIASHHGWGRPFFPPRAVDREDPSNRARLAQECVLRYGRLQEEFGHWGLAYLEALFKAADSMASQGPVEQPEDQPDGE
jgi:CRISPR-associated endonuclease/helicase Cas3